jgi:hypothetical protein
MLAAPAQGATAAAAAAAGAAAAGATCAAKGPTCTPYHPPSARPSAAASSPHSSAHSGPAGGAPYQQGPGPQQGAAVLQLPAPGLEGLDLYAPQHPFQQQAEGYEAGMHDPLPAMVGGRVNEFWGVILAEVSAVGNPGGVTFDRIVYHGDESWGGQPLPRSGAVR